MGIDARMFVRHSGKLTTAQVRELSSDLSAAFWGNDTFMIVRPGTSDYWKKGRHALEIIKKFDQDGPAMKPEDGEQFIEVHFYGRYYGPGYERGDWPKIYAVARWLKARIPGCTAWYGGDSSGVLAEEMTEEFERKMWDHFIAHGHSPYIEHDRWSRGGCARPVCDFCNRVMWNQSSGPGDRLGFTCEGCGYKCETLDNGETFREDKRKEFA